MKEDLTLRGDPEKTPFVQFESGTPLYPPPTLYESAQQLLEQPIELGVDAALNGLIRKGMRGGQFGVLPGSTWFALLKTFFSYETSSRDHTPDWCSQCRRALEMMVVRPHPLAWKGLKQFFTENMDHLSGWERSWRKIARGARQRVPG